MITTNHTTEEVTTEVFLSLASILRDAGEMVNDALQIAYMLAHEGKEQGPYFTAENAKALVADALVAIAEANERAVHAHRALVFSSFIADAEKGDK